MAATAITGNTSTSGGATREGARARAGTRARADSGEECTAEGGEAPVKSTLYAVHFPNYLYTVTCDCDLEYFCTAYVTNDLGWPSNILPLN